MEIPISSIADDIAASIPNTTVDEQLISSTSTANTNDVKALAPHSINIQTPLLSYSLTPGLVSDMSSVSGMWKYVTPLSKPYQLVVPQNPKQLHSLQYTKRGMLRHTKLMNSLEVYSNVIFDKIEHSSMVDGVSLITFNKKGDLFAVIYIYVYTVYIYM
jgi:hypothetical protein